ncbi:MAG: hypothetical protein ACE147_14185 [Candidatus Methylomirabilales bacterium]
MVHGDSGEKTLGAGAGRRGGWGGLYAILAVAALLCGVGYRLGTTPFLARLLQLGAAAAVLALLFAWVRATLPSLLAQDERLAAPARPFSAIRVPLRPRQPGGGRIADGLRARRRARVLRLAARHLPGDAR